MRNFCLIHHSNPSYLEYTLKSLKLNFTNDNLILIGDDSNLEISKKYGFKHYNIKDYTEDFNYIHFSINDKKYEEFCIMRWIILDNFMKKNKIKDVMYFDSDVLILDNKGIDICYNNNFDIYYYKNYTCVPYIIYFNDKGINFLTENIKNLYNLKKNELLKIFTQIGDKLTNIEIHISDMNLLKYIFMENDTDINIEILNNHIDDYIFFDRIQDIKCDIWYSVDNDKWYINNDNKKISIIHCQGNSKKIMKDLLEYIIKKKKIYINDILSAIN